MSTQVREQKSQVIEQLKSVFGDSTLAVVADYRGLSANNINKFRKELFVKESSAYVCKNTLAKRALNELEISFNEEMFVGPSILINTEEDAVNMSKALVAFAKDNEKFVIKGGFLQSQSITIDQIKHLASLPGREELIARVVGGIKAPITRFVCSLSSPINGFVNVLKQIEKQKTGGL